jgi:hypothetical protein
MMQLDPQRSFRDDFDNLQPQRTSGLAIGSLISSLIFCCPITTIIGVVVGLVALGRISSNPQLKGRGIAMTGIVLGILFTIGQIWIGFKIYEGYGIFRDAPYVALEPGFQGDYAAFRDAFGAAGQAATDDDARAFIDALRSRYGELRGSDIDFKAFQGMQQPAPGQTEFTLPWLIVFANAEVIAELTIREQDQRKDEIVFSRIKVLDSARGDLEFPPPPAQP